PRSLDYPASSLNNRSPSRVSSSSESAPPRVLVIEDDRDSREGLRELLESWEHVVGLADSGLEGIERALKQSPRIALIDIGLPDLDGYERAARLRRHLGKEEIFLVALTGHVGPNHDRQALDSGSAAHLPKPVRFPPLRPPLA